MTKPEWHKTAEAGAKQATEAAPAAPVASAPVAAPTAPAPAAAAPDANAATNAAEKAAPNATAKKPRGKPFKPGKSGNAAGMKPGTKHRKTLLLEHMSDDQRASIVAKIIRQAQRGCRVSQKMIQDRVEPIRKARVPISWPAISTPADVIAAMTAIEDKLARGEISSDEAANFTTVVKEKREAIEQEIILREMRDLAQQLQTLKEGKSE